LDLVIGPPRPRESSSDRRFIRSPSEEDGGGLQDVSLNNQICSRIGGVGSQGGVGNGLYTAN